MRSIVPLKIEEIRLKGIVVSGVGEGRKYVKLYSNVIKEVLGFIPFPGTLNIKVEINIFTLLHKLCSYTIPPPSPEYKPVHAYLGAVEDIVGFFIKPEATIHKTNIIEFIAPVKVRDVKKLNDGDKVLLTFYKLAINHNGE